MSVAAGPGLSWSPQMSNTPLPVLVFPSPAPTQAAKDTHHLHSNKALSRVPASSSLYPGHCTALVSWGLVTGDVDSVLVWLVWRLLAHLLLPTSCCYLLSVAPCAALGEKPWRH